MTAPVPAASVPVELRAAAAARFEALGWPSTRLEPWRYFSTRPLHAFDVEQALEAVLPLRNPLPRPLSGARLTLVNGHFLPALSEPALYGSFVHQVFAEAATLGLVPESEALEAANLAFHPLGAALQLFVPPGFRSDVPLEILHVAQANAHLAAIHPRLLVTLGEGAELTIIQRWVGECATFVNAVLEAELRPRAVLAHTTISAEMAPAQHVDALHVRVGADARFHGFVLSHGTGRARTSERVVLAEPGASAEVHGLYLGDHEARLDHFTEIVHAAPQTRSRERWHGAVDGASEGTFQGLVRIAKGAIGSDTHQLTKSLILSQDAHANAKPELHIDCDDVKAAHGATVGQLDRQALFYLEQRGLAPDEARKVLLGAFILESVRTAPLGAQPALIAALASRLGDALASGEPLTEP